MRISIAMNFSDRSSSPETERCTGCCLGECYKEKLYTSPKSEYESDLCYEQRTTFETLRSRKNSLTNTIDAANDSLSLL